MCLANAIDDDDASGCDTITTITTTTATTIASLTAASTFS